MAVSNKKKVKRGLEFWMFVGPVFLVFAVIVLVPFFNGVMYSFTDWNGITGELNWIGFDNYVRLFTVDEQFQQSFWLTTKYTVVAVVLTNLVGFIFVFTHTKYSDTEFFTDDFLHAELNRRIDSRIRLAVHLR